MKPSRDVILYSVIGLLAIGLTLASASFPWPVDCQQLCDTAEHTPCPAGSCRASEQRTGLPLPVRIDDPGGSSPTSGWGKLGPEDYPNPMTFLLDVFFYAVLLRFGWYLVQVLRHEMPLERLAVVFSMSVILAGLALGIVTYWPVLTR
jgi:hypothetical protein